MLECGQDRREVAVRQMGAMPDAQHAGPAEGDACGLVPGAHDVLEDLPRLREVGLARLGQHHAVVLADEEREAELLLELLDLAAERRLRDVEPFGRAPEVQLLGDRYEIAKMSQLHPWRYLSDMVPRPNRSWTPRAALTTIAS